MVLHKSFDVWKTDTKFLLLGFCLAVRRKRRKKHIGILATWKKKERTPPFTKEREREREGEKIRKGEMARILDHGNHSNGNPSFTVLRFEDDSGKIFPISSSLLFVPKPRERKPKPSISFSLYPTLHALTLHTRAPRPFSHTPFHISLCSLSFLLFSSIVPFRFFRLGFPPNLFVAR